MLELAKVRLRKDALIVLGLGATVLLSLPFSVLVTPHDMAARQAMEAAWAFWLVLGLPGFAALLGGAAGAELASEPGRAAENLLPLAPSGRAWAALGAAGLQLAALVLLVLAVGATLTVKASDVVELGFRAAQFWESGAFDPFLLAFAACLPYLLLVSLLGGYATGNGVLGGILGSTLAGGCFFGMAAGLLLQTFHSYRITFDGWACASWLAAVLGGLAALRATASARERRTRVGWARLAGLVGASLFGACLAIGAMWWKAFDISHHVVTRIVGPRAPSAQGVLLHTVGRDVLWGRPDGSTVTLLRGPARAFDRSWDDLSLAWDDHGTLWALRRAESTVDNYELWSGDPEHRLALRSRFVSPYGLELGRRGDRVVVHAYYESKFAPVPFPGPQPIWQKAKDANDRFHSSESLVLSPAKKSWILSARKDGGNFVTVMRGENPAPARYGAVMAGGWWVSARGKILWSGGDGRTHGPAPLPKLSDEKGHEEVLRSDGDRLWLAGHSTLVVLQEGVEAPVLQVALPDASATFALNERSAHAVKDGFFWHTTYALYFVDWEGHARRIGR